MKILLYTGVFFAAFAITILSLGNFSAYKAEKLPNIDKIVIRKSARELQLYEDGQPVKTYKIALGRNPVGHKQQEGDSKTPEGLYYITHHNPCSSYHLSLGISYPNEQDKENARRLGVSPGGNIMIHGLPNYAPFFGSLHRLKDWTQGCIAVDNTEIEEIYSAVHDGTPIEILP